MVDTERHGFAQHSAGFIRVARFTKHMWSCKLHRAIAHPVDGNRGAGKGEATGCGCRAALNIRYRGGGRMIAHLKSPFPGL
jgi:hypothetical protein